MNNDVAIKVENLSKRYRIGQYVGRVRGVLGLRYWVLATQEITGI